MAYPMIIYWGRNVVDWRSVREKVVSRAVQGRNVCMRQMTAGGGQEWGGVMSGGLDYRVQGSVRVWGLISRV